MNEVFKIGNEAVVMDPSSEAIPFLQNADPNFTDSIHSAFREIHPEIPNR